MIIPESEGMNGVSICLEIDETLAQSGSVIWKRRLIISSLETKSSVFCILKHGICMSLLGAAVTKHYKLGDLNNRNLLFWNSGRLLFEIKMSTELIPSEGCEESVSHASLLTSALWLTSWYSMAGGNIIPTFGLMVTWCSSSAYLSPNFPFL